MDFGGSCSVPHPLNVTSLGSGVAIGPETILNCAATRSARPLGEGDRGARRRRGCSARRRPRSSTTRPMSAAPATTMPQQKISEHAHANAVDIAAFGFADRDPVEIGRSKRDRRRRNSRRRSAPAPARYFTTVLGPGSNAAHATHFHLDMAFRRGGYRLCELGAPSTVARALKRRSASSRRRRRPSRRASRRSRRRSAAAPARAMSASA